MNTILILFTTVWCVLAFNLGQCNVMIYSLPLFSPEFRKIIVGIYNHNFENFNEIHKFSEKSDDINFKADTLLGLYDAMSVSHHAEMPLYALELYNKIEALLSINSTSMYKVNLDELERIRLDLLLNTIVPKASHILEAGAYGKLYDIQGSSYENLLKMLLTTNHTVSNLIFDEMVAKVRWSIPVIEITPRFANFSPYIEQNVDILLSLYEDGPFHEAENNIILSHMKLLRKKSEYIERVSPESQIKQDVIMPITDFLHGTVCFYQKLSNGNRLYFHEHVSHYHICAYEYSVSQRKAAFEVALKENPLTFSFRSVVYLKRAMCILPKEPEQEEDFQYDVYSPETPCTDINWKVHLEGEQVVLQNINSTKFLCAGTTSGNNAYTRNKDSFLLHKDECKWFVEDCNQFN